MSASIKCELGISVRSQRIQGGGRRVLQRLETLLTPSNAKEATLRFTRQDKIRIRKK